LDIVGFLPLCWVEGTLDNGIPQPLKEALLGMEGIKISQFHPSYYEAMSSLLVIMLGGFLKGLQRLGIWSADREKKGIRVGETGGTQVILFTMSIEELFFNEKQMIALDRN